MIEKIDAKAEAALRQGDSRALAYEMTDERKQKFMRVSGQIVDLLRANTDGPTEGYMILHFVIKAFEERYGIRGAIVLGDEAQQ